MINGKLWNMSSSIHYFVGWTDRDGTSQFGFPTAAKDRIQGEVEEMKRLHPGTDILVKRVVTDIYVVDEGDNDAE